MSEAALYVLTDAGADDGGNRSAVTPDASVADSAILQFTTPVELRDIRVRVLDADDRLVPTHADLTVGDGWTVANIAPATFWPGHACCRFVVDSQVDRLLCAGDWQFVPFEAHFTVTPNPERSSPVDDRHKVRRRARR